MLRSIGTFYVVDIGSDGTVNNEHLDNIKEKLTVDDVITVSKVKVERILTKQWLDGSDLREEEIERIEYYLDVNDANFETNLINSFQFYLDSVLHTDNFLKVEIKYSKQDASGTTKEVYVVERSYTMEEIYIPYLDLNKGRTEDKIRYEISQPTGNVAYVYITFFGVAEDFNVEGIEDAYALEFDQLRLISYKQDYLNADKVQKKTHFYGKNNTFTFKQDVNLSKNNQIKNVVVYKVVNNGLKYMVPVVIKDYITETNRKLNHNVPEPFIKPIDKNDNDLFRLTFSGTGFDITVTEVTIKSGDATIFKKQKLNFVFTNGGSETHSLDIPYWLLLRPDTSIVVKTNNREYNVFLINIIKGE